MADAVFAMTHAKILHNELKTCRRRCYAALRAEARLLLLRQPLSSKTFCVGAQLRRFIGSRPIHRFSYLLKDANSRKQTC